MKKHQPKIIYSDYLQLDKILGAQSPLSAQIGKEVHEEHFFIIIHQVYELWFKQILVDLDEIFALFRQEKDMELIVMRLQRIGRIFRLLIQQLDVIETMTPLQFLGFRELLDTMSGFQSYQFRTVEAKFGIRRQDRISYLKCPYDIDLKTKQQEIIHQAEEHDSLFDYCEQWLSKFPFLKTKKFDFLAEYKKAYEKWRGQNKGSKHKCPVSGAEDSQNELGNDFDYLFDEHQYQKERAAGHRRLSHQAFAAALFIRLYRSHSYLHIPDLLLTEIVDLNSLISLWRFRHSTMVQKMIGWKKGTGGSSGVEYLHTTVEKYDVFSDLYHVPMVMLPEKEFPQLPNHLLPEVNFFFANAH